VLAAGVVGGGGNRDAFAQNNGGTYRPTRGTGGVRVQRDVGSAHQARERRHRGPHRPGMSATEIGDRTTGIVRLRAVGRPCTPPDTGASELQAPGPARRVLTR